MEGHADQERGRAWEEAYEYNNDIIIYSFNEVGRAVSSQFDALGEISLAPSQIN